MYQIINCEFWFSAQYISNSSLWIEGKWDVALNEAMFKLRELEGQHRKHVVDEKASRDAVDAHVDAIEKQAIEQFFV